MPDCNDRKEIYWIEMYNEIHTFTPIYVLLQNVNNNIIIINTAEQNFKVCKTLSNIICLSVWVCVVCLCQWCGWETQLKHWKQPNALYICQTVCCVSASQWLIWTEPCILPVITYCGLEKQDCFLNWTKTNGVRDPLGVLYIHIYKHYMFFSLIDLLYKMYIYILNQFLLLR